MISKRTTHNIILPALALVCAVGCTDDLLDDRINAGDPNAVKFTTSVSRAFDARTRSAAIPLYEPLVLTSAEGGQPLYLHTFETDKVGYRPGIDAVSPQTRGMQVESVEDLEKYHTDFMVHAAFKDDGEDYIEWTKTYPSSKGSNIWLTTGTRYWPAEEELSFQAIAPSSEFGNLKSLHTSDANITFSYTALKGNGSNDAEAQKDLLLASSSCNKAGSVQGRAPLKFHHALSSIKFAVRDVLGSEVVKIQIVNVHGSADCHYTADAGGENGSFTWSGHGNKTSYGQNFNYKIADRVVDTSDDSQDIILNEKMPEKTFMLNL